MSRQSLFAVSILMAAFTLLPLTMEAQQKDYLTEVEANKIRDEQRPGERIKLFLSFATDRLKKFQYELARPSTTPRRGEMLNRLLNAYTGCVDDAAELIALGQERQQDIRVGIKEMQSKTRDFLTILEPLQTNGTDLPLYKETLTDAMEATKDAQAEAERAAKEIAPPPVRRKQ